MGSERAWLTLHHKPLKENCKKALIVECGDPERVLGLSASEIGRMGRARTPAVAAFQREQVDCDKIERSMAENEIKLLPYTHEHYPPLLREIPDPPMLLYARGDTSVLVRRSLSVVGSRLADRGAVKWTEALGEIAAASGALVTSGLALGIDAAAHRGALRTGATAAVLGNGLAHVFPSRNTGLARSIENQGGVVLSEFAPEVLPDRHHFPQRNRIVAGMSEGVVLVQAAHRSGANITSRYAADYNRDLFVLVASPWDGRFAGNHRFLRDGGTFVVDPGDALFHLGIEEVRVAPDRVPEDASHSNASPIPTSWGETTQSIVKRLILDDTDLETLCASLALRSDDVLHRITRLEMQGYVEELPGQRFHWNGPVGER